MKEKILEIHTDASGDNKNGLGILFINPDESERQFSYKVNKDIFYSHINNVHVTDDDVIINIMQLEMMAMYVAIKELETYSRSYDRIILYSDNLPCIEFLNNINSNKKENESTNSVIELSNVIKDLLKKINISVDFRWIKSHCGVYGNEVADRLAKVGARKTNLYGKFSINNIQHSLFNDRVVVWRKPKNPKKGKFETVFLKVC